MGEVRRPLRAWAALGRLEFLLWATGILCLALITSRTVTVRATQRTADTLVSGSSQPRSVLEATAVTGKLTIRQIGLSVPILDNFDSGSLARGVGHIPGTAVPGGLGNVGLAGHRDTFFRPLRNVRAGMEVQVGTADRHWLYSVDRTEIVTPEQVSVLDIGDRPEMTLITCYPFDYVGAAPKRFIVHAHLLSLIPAP